MIARKIVGFSLAGLCLLSLISSLVAWYFGYPDQWAGIPVGEFLRVYAPFQYEFWSFDISGRYLWVCAFARIASLAAIAFVAIRCWIEIDKVRAMRVDDFGEDRWAKVKDLKRKDLI